MVPGSELQVAWLESGMMRRMLTGYFPTLHPLTASCIDSKTHCSIGLDCKDLNPADLTPNLRL